MDKFSFHQNVYQVVKLIPKGRVTSYGAVAKYLGMRSGARMVGWALNQSIMAKDPIPAHRVVNRNGLLTGKAHFPDGIMEKLLTEEGLIIKNDQILNFDERFWDPMTELDVL